MDRFVVKKLMNDFTYNAVAKMNASDGMQWQSLLLAGLVHLALLAFLVIGVQWQSSETVAVEVDVWDMTTREAAPLPIEPELPKEDPQPIVEPPKEIEKPVEQEDPEIAIAQEKKRKKLEKEKEDAKKQTGEKAVKVVLASEQEQNRIQLDYLNSLEEMNNLYDQGRLKAIEEKKRRRPHKTTATARFC